MKNLKIFFGAVGALQCQQDLEFLMIIKEYVMLAHGQKGRKINWKARQAELELCYQNIEKIMENLTV